MADALTRYSRTQTAQLLRLSVRQIDRLVSLGQLDAIHESGRTWIDAASVERQLKQTYVQMPLPLPIPGVTP